MVTFEEVVEAFQRYGNEIDPRVIEIAYALTDLNDGIQNTYSPDSVAEDAEGVKAKVDALVATYRAETEQRLVKWAKD